MRLDKYLKVSRLIKRRNVANDACDATRVTVNGKVAKASYNVKIGDLITVTFGNRAVTVRVLNIVDMVCSIFLFWRVLWPNLFRSRNW